MISPCRLGELEQVVGGADHRPFASHLIKASKEELSEASGMFDLAKDRLDDLLAQSRTRSSLAGAPRKAYGAPVILIRDCIANNATNDEPKAVARILLGSTGSN